MVFSSHSPGRMRECGIYDLEMCDSFYGARLADELFPDREVILCGDNRGTAQTLAKGACRAETANHMCAAFWALAAAHSISVWIEDAPGVINPADPPSRDCTACEKPPLCHVKEVRYTYPLSSILYSRDSLAQSQFSIPSVTWGVSLIHGSARAQ